MQPAIKLHAVLLSAFEAWGNLPFLQKPLQLKASQNPPIPSVGRSVPAFSHLFGSKSARFKTVNGVKIVISGVFLLKLILKQFCCTYPQIRSVASVLLILGKLLTIKKIVPGRITSLNLLTPFRKTKNSIKNQFL